MTTDIGARIGVDGEKEFRSALSAINADIKNLNSSMKNTVERFAGMEDSEEAVTAKSKVLQQAIDAEKQKISLIGGEYDRAKNKLDGLADKLDAATREFGANSSEAAKAQNAYNKQVAVVKRLESQMTDANTVIIKMQREMNSLGNEAEDLTKDLNDAGKGASSFGDILKGSLAGGAISGAVQSLIGSMSGLVDETMEYRTILGTLETSSGKAGYTAEQTAESYAQLYGVIGDNQQAATALANLQALGLEQNQLKTLTEGVIGAWATYGDSIPIDGLAEAVNETIRVSTVTGTFADVLNWAGTSEDEFNEKLQACKTEAERTNLVLEELAKQGLAETSEAWRENNKDIVALREAEMELQEVTAEFGEMATPIIAGVKKGTADILKGVISLLNGSNPMLPLLAGIGAGITALALATLISNLAGSAKGVETLKNAFNLLNGVLRANPIAIVISLLAALAAGLFTAYQTNEEFRNAVNNAWQEIKTFVVGNAMEIKNTVLGLPNTFRTAGREMINGLWQGAQDIWSSFRNWFTDKINWVQDKLMFWRDAQDEMNSSGTTSGGGAGRYIDGSHANGLAYVPYDGYIAQLHKGERVLTAGENQAYSSNSNSIQNVFYVSATVREEADIKKIAQALNNLQRNDARGRGVVMI